MTLVLVVDDCRAIAEQYAYDLDGWAGTRCHRPGRRQALELIGGEPVDCVILDLEMPGWTASRCFGSWNGRASQFR